MGRSVENSGIRDSSLPTVLRTTRRSPCGGPTLRSRREECISAGTTRANVAGGHRERGQRSSQLGDRGARSLGGPPTEARPAHVPLLQPIAITCSPHATRIFPGTRHRPISPLRALGIPPKQKRNTMPGTLAHSSQTGRAAWSVVARSDRHNTGGKQPLLGELLGGIHP